MRKLTRLFALMLALTMLLGALPALAEEPANPSGIPYYKVTSDLYDFIDMDGAPIQIEIYSQLANYSGRQTGWGAALMKDLFNVELVIIPDQDGTYQTRTQSGNLGDIVVWGANGEDYKQAIKNGLLLEWDEDDLAETYAPYVWANYQDALASNRLVSEDGDNLYGFGMDVATSRQGHKSFMYSWDLRWDLYSQLGYPEIKNLDDLLAVFKKMKEICPTDELGNETYAASLWPDWDGNMVMYVKAMATAYYRYDELGFGLYNPTNGEFYDALDENGPYIEMLRFFNQLYRAGLLDPNSMTQTYDEMSQKVKNGGVFWGIFNYASSMVYNTDKHLGEGKMMYARVPDEANPIVYGLSTLGGNRIWSVGSKAAYPELCLAILDFFATPEGSMTMWYGPRGLMWDYDENGGMYFTELGDICNKDTKHDLNGVVWTSPYTGKQYTLSGNFNDGCIQANNTTARKASQRVEQRLSALHEHQEDQQGPKKRNDEPPVVLEQCDRIHELVVFRSYLDLPEHDAQLGDEQRGEERQEEELEIVQGFFFYPHYAFRYIFVKLDFANSVAFFKAFEKAINTHHTSLFFSCLTIPISGVKK